MKILACIPARYGSTRFPAKVLAKETGKYLIQHTWEQAKKSKLCSEVLIAADDKRICQACAEFGAKCVLTSPEHQSGTDRIAEAVASMDADIIINIQADEPQIEPANIDKAADLLIKNPDVPMATLAAKFKNPAQIADPNIVKVILDSSGRAIYFSRSVIPNDRDAGGIGQIQLYLRHIGIYGYRKDFLLKLTKLPQTPLEKAEKLEQLRAIEHGHSILVGIVEQTFDGIDTQEQYREFVQRYMSRNQV